MKKLSLILTALASLVMVNYVSASTQVIKSGSITYTVTDARLDSHCGDVLPAEGTKYLMVYLTAKNTSPSDQTLGGLFASNFKVQKDGFKYDVDGGAGLAFGSLSDAYTGVKALKPLIPVRMIVVFTVPTEIASGTWTVTTPTNDSFNVTVN